MDETRPPARAPDPRVGGPLTRDEALAMLERAAELLGSGDFQAAGEHYARVVGFDDPTITAAALLGLGEVRYRLDDEAAAVATWSAVLRLGETPSTYATWRNLAAARVRAGDLPGAIVAYREADRRAPREDKPEIANRLGWLTKETGDPRAARRYFAAGRGDSPLLTVTLAIIGLTSIVTLMAWLSTDGYQITRALWLDKPGVAAGEYWRLWTVTLLHADPLHLLFNMYALYLAGPIVERWYGRARFLLFYLVLAAAGSTGSFVFGGDVPAVGASGAIFGLFGMLLAAGRLHHPVDRQSRALVGQIGFLAGWGQGATGLKRTPTPSLPRSGGRGRKPASPYLGPAVLITETSGLEREHESGTAPHPAATSPRRQDGSRRGHGTSSPFPLRRPRLRPDGQPSGYPPGIPRGDLL